jgi:hypothetical protein
MTLGVSDVGAVRYRIPHHHHRNTTMARLKSDPLHRKTERPKEATRDSGSLATFASLTILPCASTTHTLENSNDTSIPAKGSMLFSVSRCLGPTQRRHTVALAAADLAGPSRNRRWIPRHYADVASRP